MKIKSPKEYANKLKKRKHPAKGMSKKHSAPKRRCVTMIDKKHRCLERPVDGKHCTKHGGVAPQVVTAALRKEGKRMRGRQYEHGPIEVDATQPIGRLGQVSMDVLPPELQKDYGPHGQCNAKNSRHNRCGNKAINDDGFCKLHKPVEEDAA